MYCKIFTILCKWYSLELVILLFSLTLLFLVTQVYKDGALTPLLANLEKADVVEVGIPKGKFGSMELEKATKSASYLILLAAGTGITPMTSLLLESLNNET